MSNTTHHGVPVNIQKEYQLYEQLPAIVRRALANAAFDWKIGAFHKAYMRDGMSGPAVARMIREADSKSIAHDRARVWGITKKMERDYDRRKGR